ncbi:MAG: CAP domain-containing protein [Anaerolineales bacterium]
MKRSKIPIRLLVLILPMLFYWAVGQNSTIQRALGKEAQRGDGYQVIALVNQVRAAYGLAPLNANSALMTAAQGHSDYQASIGSITHTGAGGSSPLSRAMAAGYGGGVKVYVSENIYGGNDASPSQAVSWWQSDSIHLQTMINPNATDAGAGVAYGGSTVYYTLDVGYISGQAAESTAGVPVINATRPPTAIPIIPIQTATPNSDGSIYHIVQSGQALWNIAAAYKVSLAELMSMNGLTADSLIYPGQKIMVRKGSESTPTSDVTATLAPTATLLYQNTPTVKLPDLTLAQQTQTIPLGILVTDTPIIKEDSNLASNGDPLRWLILGLFLLGGALILVGSLMRPKN